MERPGRITIGPSDSLNIQIGDFSVDSRTSMRAAYKALIRLFPNGDYFQYSMPDTMGNLKGAGLMGRKKSCNRDRALMS